jgi:Ran GTPase-activating protein (RanGAP) involved in mRNA processing and transport
LSVADNDIISDGGNILGDILASNVSLFDLNVSLNRLGDDGGKSLIEGLEKNCTLHSLNLASNSLGSNSIAALSKVLQVTQPSSSLTGTSKNYSSLAEIDLSSNKFSDTDMVKLAKAVQQNNRIVSLDIRTQTISNVVNTVEATKVVESSIEIINKKLTRNTQAS